MIRACPFCHKEFEQGQSRRVYCSSFCKAQTHSRKTRVQYNVFGEEGPMPYLKLRFDILERDDFTCQYCGRSAPKVELEVDHVLPSKLGGLTTKDNLVAVCVDCNRGKGDRLLALRRTDKETIEDAKMEVDR